jgi:hypothetical protein
MASDGERLSSSAVEGAVWSMRWREEFDDLLQRIKHARVGIEQTVERSRRLIRESKETLDSVDHTLNSTPRRSPGDGAKR